MDLTDHSFRSPPLFALLMIFMLPCLLQGQKTSTDFEKLPADGYLFEKQELSDSSILLLRVATEQAEREYQQGGALAIQVVLARQLEELGRKDQLRERHVKAQLPLLEALPFFSPLLYLGVYLLGFFTCFILLKKYQLLRRPPPDLAAPKLTNMDEGLGLPPEDERSEWFFSLEAIVNRRMGEFGLKAEDIALELGVSRTQFFRMMKKELGLTPLQYLQSSRIQRARNLLENGKVDSVKAAAFEVGFKQVKYFSRLYKEHFGYSPSDILKK